MKKMEKGGGEGGGAKDKAFMHSNMPSMYELWHQGYGSLKNSIPSSVKGGHVCEHA